jgi:hypothetical protein
MKSERIKKARFVRGNGGDHYASGIVHPFMQKTLARHRGQHSSFRYTELSQRINVGVRFLGRSIPFRSGAL